MIIYFVRHGESEGNAANIHQNAEVILSEIGKSQAKMAGYRLKNVPVDVILASDYVRTQQTAEIINLALSRPMETTPLLREFKRPSEIVGKSIHDPYVVKVKQMIKDHRDESEWHFSDEENFFDFRLRAKTCLHMLESRPESHILCVTHGFFLCVMLSVIVFGDDLTPMLFEKMYHQFHNNNTGISIFEYNEEGWRVLTWNDHAHLG